jgi:hypothetical protein
VGYERGRNGSLVPGGAEICGVVVPGMMGALRILLGTEDLQGLPTEKLPFRSAPKLLLNKVILLSHT